MECDQSTDLNWPKSIACTHYGDVVLCDKTNHRLIVYNRELVLKYTIGSKGNLDSQFDEPFDLAISAINDLLVADKNNYRVQIFDEDLIMRKLRTKINAFDEQKYDEMAAGTQNSTNRLQFKFKHSIHLDNKPVKVFASTLNALFGVATQHGTIYIFNTAYKIMSVLQFDGYFDIIDLKNIFINKTGNGIVSIKYENNRLMLKNYSFAPDASSKMQRSKSLLKYRHSECSSRKATRDHMAADDRRSVISKMELVREVELQKAYYPGISIERALCLTPTPDLNNLIVYDPKNLCVIVYDLDGNFIRILFRAYDNLKHIVSMCFSPEGHFITCEYEIKQNAQRLLNEFNRAYTSLTTKYIFKIRMYRYSDCECHRNLPAKIKIDPKSARDRVRTARQPKTTYL